MNDRAEILVREATEADGSFVLAMTDQLAEFERANPIDAAAKTRLLRDLFGQPRRVISYIAELNGERIACANTHDGYTSFRALPTLFLDDIIVAAEHRRSGAGRALIKHLLGIAAQGGYARLEWLVLNWNQDAIAFYESIGAQRRGWIPFMIEVEHA